MSYTSSSDRSNTLHLVSCVSKKQPFATQAERLYVSDWFKKARRHVKRLEGEWFILSAEYGLLDPCVTVQPYERTLNKMSKAERQDWSGLVLHQLQPVIRNKTRVVFWAGQRYREFLVEPLQKAGLEVEIPLEGLKIGEQLKWFKGAQEKNEQLSRPNE